MIENSGLEHHWAVTGFSWFGMPPQGDGLVRRIQTHSSSRQVKILAYWLAPMLITFEDFASHVLPKSWNVFDGGDDGGLLMPLDQARQYRWLVGKADAGGDNANRWRVAGDVPASERRLPIPQRLPASLTEVVMHGRRLRSISETH